MLGKAKTRLAATVGDERALAIYKELLKHTREVTLGLNVERALFYSHFIDNGDEWGNDFFRKYLQEGEDLGLRMANGFDVAFKNGSQKAIIIGSDCASLTPQIVEDAFLLLDKNDFVIGPADDGGYYLLGMNSFSPTLFENIEWSTEEVFPQTIAAIEELGKSYGTLPTLSDIDFEEDWKKYGWEF